MTASDFRRLALSLPESTESAHMDHPDFRVGGKIFATLGPKEEWGMVKLTPELQASFVRAMPKVFEPVNGAWGRRGCTYVRLGAVRRAAAERETVRQALLEAWRNTAPKKLVQQHAGE